ncbi:MAG: hypothetical protein H6611_09530 [Ignavibacteriales bacterium]|nr:hypothetical protein [Ignavibacteriales bacterium]
MEPDVWWLPRCVGGEVKFVCVDGPEFDGHKVDFDNMMARLNSYKEIEQDKHTCYIDSMYEEKKL